MNFKDLDIWIFDCEVFRYDWFFVFKNRITKEYQCFHNEPEELIGFLKTETPWLSGFNTKHYDNYITKGVLGGLDNVPLKRLSDDIVIHKMNGWEHPYIRDLPFVPAIKSCDLRDDMYEGLSLKQFEGHMFMDIEETDVDFNRDTELTEEEIELVFKYCRHDVDATDTMFDRREDYIMTKLAVGEKKNLEPREALSMTNAKLVAVYLEARRQEYTDGREYTYPTELKLEYIPPEVKAFFDSFNDKSISDEELFDTSCNITLSGCPCTFRWGGAHGSLKNVVDESDDEWVIQNRDVESLYPSLIIEYDYLSRSCKDKKIYRETRDARIRAKHGQGNPKDATTLKLIINNTSGSMDAKFSDLYDPHQARSMRITGQLLTCELICHLIKDVPTFALMNYNTDGFAYKVKRMYLPLVDEICKEWETRTRLKLETDNILKIWIKDVSNYIAIEDGGKVKKVGSYVNWGESKKGAYNINNNYIVCKKALIDYLTKGIPVEKTILEDDNIFDFQIIAYAGSSYDGVYQEKGDSYVKVQRVNRVYASKDETNGSLFKTKVVNGVVRKEYIAKLPDHCIIDNSNKLTIEDVSKQYYIDLANDFVRQFLKGKQKQRKEMPMAQLNLFLKIQKIRNEVLASALKQTGKNNHMLYTYFELADILPTVTPLMDKYGITTQFKFDKEFATLTLINSEKPEETLVYQTIMPTPSALMSNSGKVAVTEIQTIGAYMTYMRRYLYMLAFDIVEADGVEELANQQGAASADKAKKITKVDEEPIPVKVLKPKKVVEQVSPTQVKEEASTEEAPKQEAPVKVPLKPKVASHAPKTADERQEIVQNLTSENVKPNDLAKELKLKLNTAMAKGFIKKETAQKIIANVRDKSPNFPNLTQEVYDYAINAIKNNQA